MQSESRQVTAVIAAQDLQFLPATLAAVAAQQHRPDELIIADTSADGLDISPILPSALHPRIEHHPQAQNLGDAVRAVLDQGEDVSSRWLWLLHDDSPPEPAALAELLRHTANTRTVALAGCKQVHADAPDRLISVGVRTTAGGQRLSGIESGEIDQGQYDGLDDVYAVGTAGLFIRRDMWDTLNGPDPALGPFGDGIDLSRRTRLAGARVVIVPSAIVRHERATLTDRRSPRPDRRRSVRARRQAQIHHRLTAVSWPGMMLQAILTVLATPVRSLWRVATSEPGLAVDEWAALAAVLTRPGDIYRARRQEARTRTVPRRALRPLYAPRTAILRKIRDGILQRLDQRRQREAPSELEMRERAVAAIRRRGVLVGLLLLTGVVTVMIGTRALAGDLIGGGLAGLDGSGAELVETAFSPWLSIGDGHPGPPDPFWAVLALIGVTLGSPFGLSAAAGVSMLLTISVPLAAVGAWFAAGAATRSLTIRAWAALIWALGPAMIVALLGGDVAALSCHITLPFLALAITRAFGFDRQDVIVSGLVGAARVPRTRVLPQPRSRSGRHRDGRDVDRSDAAEAAGETFEHEDASSGELVDDEELVALGLPNEQPLDPTDEPDEPALALSDRISGTGSLGAAAAAGLLLAIAAASAPFLLPIAVLVLIALAFTVRRRRGRLILMILPALVLFAPVLISIDELWPVLFTSPTAAIDPIVQMVPAPPAAILLGWPGMMPQTTWVWWAGSAIGASVVVAALTSLLRNTSIVASRIGLLIAAAGIACATLAPDLGAGMTSAVSIMTLGLLIAGVSGMHGMTRWLRQRSFGWRQSVAAALTLGVALGAIGAVSFGWYGVQDEDHMLWSSRSSDPMPALSRELAAGPERSRALALAYQGGSLTGQLWRGNGPQLVDQSRVNDIRVDMNPAAARAESDEASQELTQLVAELSLGAAADAASTLAHHAVSVVLVPPLGSNSSDDQDEPTPQERAQREDLMSSLDAVSGLDHITENESGAMWRVNSQEDIARVRVTGEEGTQIVPAEGTAAAGTVAAGADRTVVLAERADPGWQASWNGRPLRSLAHGWQQAFEIPGDESGRLTIQYQPAGTTTWHISLIVVFGLTLLLALPTRRRPWEM